MKKFAAGIVATLAFSAVTVTGTGAATPSHHPAISHLVVSSRVLGDEGGNVTVSADIKHAITCLLEVSPKVQGFRAVTPCDPKVLRLIHLPANRSHHPDVYRFGLTAYKTATSHSATATFAVEVKATPMPKPKPPVTTTTTSTTTTVPRPPPTIPTTTTTTTTTTTLPDHLELTLTYTISGDATIDGQPAIPADGGILTISGSVNGPDLAHTNCNLWVTDDDYLSVPCDFSGIEMGVRPNPGNTELGYFVEFLASDLTSSKTVTDLVEQLPS